MFHPELGLTTFEIHEQERLAKLAEDAKRNEKLTEIAMLLHELLRTREQDEDAVQDMIEEGGPLIDNEQGENDD